jgi:hypothetical protein
VTKMIVTKKDRLRNILGGISVGPATEGPYEARLPRLPVSILERGNGVAAV